jgi:hypothetical protein
MKPNLFRSISNSLAESFPILPRIKQTFTGLLIFCIVFLLLGIIAGDGITVPVKPMPKSKYADVEVATYNTGSVSSIGDLHIPNPGILEKVLLSNFTTKELDMITPLFLAIASIIILLIVPKLQQGNLFRKDISNYIRVLGYLMAAHGFLIFYVIQFYAPSKIEAITNNEFTSFKPSFPLFLYAETYFSLVVIALAGFYQRGIKLQEEQDLTV